MKNAPTSKDESAPDKRDYTLGKRPARTNTVTAAVLAMMLESKKITGMEAVFNQCTTRLAAVIEYLERKYDWKIERRDIAVDTKDGRIAWITIYWLPQQSISTAFEAGAREWIDKVKVARIERRKQAGKCKASAAIKNAARNQDPRQGKLWGDA